MDWRRTNPFLLASSLFVLFVFAYYPRHCHASLVAKFSFDEGSGSSFSGTSGRCGFSVPEGTLNGAGIALETADCVEGGCLHTGLSGSQTSFARIPGLKLNNIDSNVYPPRVLPSSGEFSSSFWLKLDASAAQVVPFGTATPASEANKVLMEQPDFILFQWRQKIDPNAAIFIWAHWYTDSARYWWAQNNGANPTYQSWDGTEWVHIVTTSSPTYFRFYVNGSIEREYVNDRIMSSSTSNDLILGNRAQTTPSTGFQGTIDELHFFDHALTQAEIDALGSVGAGGGGGGLSVPVVGNISVADNATVAVEYTSEGLPVYAVQALSSITLQAALATSDAPSEWYWRAEQTFTCEQSATIDNDAAQTPTFTAGPTVGDYRIDVCAFGEFECTSSSAILRITPILPIISEFDIQNTTVTVGELLVFSIEAYGLPEPLVEWQYLSTSGDEEQSRSTRFVDGRYITRENCRAELRGIAECVEAFGDPESLDRAASSSSIDGATPLHLMARGDDPCGGANETGINGTFGNFSGCENATVWLTYKNSTGPTLTFTGDLAEDGIVLRARVYSAFGEVYSPSATLRVVETPPNGDGGAGDDLQVAAALGGSLGSAAALSCLVVTCCAVLMCVCCVCAILVMILARASQSDDFVKLTPPNYREVAYRGMLQEMYAFTKAHEDTYDQLERFIIEYFGTVPYGILETCATADLDKVSQALLYLSHLNGLSYELVCSQIRIEAEQATSEGTLFRHNSASTKMFTAYMRIIGSQWVWRCFAPLVYKLNVEMEDKHAGSEEEADGMATVAMDTFDVNTPNISISPTSLALSDDLDEAVTMVNILQLRLLAQKVLQTIFQQQRRLPDQVKGLLYTVKAAVAERSDFEHTAVYRAIGGFFFLRYINVAVSAPTAFGLSAEMPNPKAQRTLILLCKVLQNVANNTLPGLKEEYMTPLNDFVTDNVPLLSTFYEKLLAEETVPTISDAWDPEPVVRKNALAGLHKFLYHKSEDDLASHMAMEEAVELRNIVSTSEPVNSI